MKTIKIIDLLNMISKGEEVPKKIKYKNCIFENRCVIDYWCKKTETCLDELILTQNLNDEVEIIEEDNKDNFTGWKMYQDGKEVCSMDCSTNEEHKIPEKLDIQLNSDDENKVNYYSATNLECDLAFKINEILDYLEVNNGIMERYT